MVTHSHWPCSEQLVQKQPLWRGGSAAVPWYQRARNSSLPSPSCQHGLSQKHCHHSILCFPIEPLPSPGGSAVLIILIGLFSHAHCYSLTPRSPLLISQQKPLTPVHFFPFQPFFSLSSELLISPLVATVVNNHKSGLKRHRCVFSLSWKWEVPIKSTYDSEDCRVGSFWSVLGK